MFEYFDAMYGNDLSHSIRGGNNSGIGKERAGHKYQSRYWKNGRWYYVYSTLNGEKNGRKANGIFDWFKKDKKISNESEKEGPVSKALFEKRQANVHNSEGGKMARATYDIYNENKKQLAKQKKKDRTDGYVSGTDQQVQDINNYYKKNNGGRDMTWAEYYDGATTYRTDNKKGTNSFANQMNRMAAATGARDMTSGHVSGKGLYNMGSSYEAQKQRNETWKKKNGFK